MNKLLLLLVIPLLFSCDLLDKKIEDELDRFVWTDSSESITITQFNPLLMDVSDQNIEITVSKQNMPLTASDLLKTIRVTTDDLSCVQDGTTYKTVIFDSSGESEEYYSTDSDCNENDYEFISTEHLVQLFDLLITSQQ